MHIQDKSPEELSAELTPANNENKLTVDTANNYFVAQDSEQEEHVAELIIQNKENALALIIANEEISLQNKESEKRTVELVNAYKELKDIDKKLAFQNEEKAKRAAELFIANEELAFQNSEKEKRSEELSIANKELIFQNQEKGKRAAELFIANNELAYQNREKEKRSDELNIANKELIFQNLEKEKRAAELTKSKQLLEETERLVKLGGWEVDLSNNEMSWSDMIYQIHEVNPDYQPTIESSLNFFAPESVPVITKAVKEIIEFGSPFDVDLQLITAKQNRIWVRVIGNPYPENGKIQKIGGMFQDITQRKLAEEVLLKMKKAINTSSEAIFLTDSEGIFSYVNPAFTSLYGYASEEIVGKATPDIIRSGSLEEPVDASFWKTLLNGDDVRGEVINKKKDGSSIHIESSSTPILDEENKIIGFLGIQRDITERKQTEVALKNSQQELRKFAMHLQNIREEEKIGVAREIHDDLGQMLVALKIDIGLFKKRMSKGTDTISSDEIVTEFDQLSDMVDKTIKTTRRIMTGLRPEIIDSLGFIEAGKSYILEFEERHRIPCQFETTISELKITPQQSVALFRILQEALTNIAKHAKATAVNIQLRNLANKLILEIIDNGIGFDNKPKVRQDSYGMIEMKERVILLEGELIITGQLGKGTSVRVEMTYNG